MQFAFVNMTTGQIVAPFNSVSAAEGQRAMFPKEHDCHIFPLYACVQWALDARKPKGR